MNKKNNYSEYPIITDPFTITNEGTFRFVKNCSIAYWTSINQQCVEKLIGKDEWIKLSWDESHRIAKQFLKEYTINSNI